MNNMRIGKTVLFATLILSMSVGSAKSMKPTHPHIDPSRKTIEAEYKTLSHDQEILRDEVEKAKTNVRVLERREKALKNSSTNHYKNATFKTKKD